MWQPDTVVSTPAAEVLAIEDPVALLAALHPPRKPQIISVIDDSDSDKIIFQGFRPEARVPVVDYGSCPKPSASSIDMMLKEIAGLFEDVAPRGYDEESEAAESQQMAISGVGQRYFRDLIPPQLAKELLRWRDGTCVTLTTNDRWIPWELLHDGRDFLGRRFLLFRLPRISDQADGNDDVPDRLEDSADVPDTHLRIVHIVGGDLRGDYVHTQLHLFDKLVPEPDRLYKLVDCYGSQVIKAIADAALIHFDCHGYREPTPRLQTKAKTSGKSAQLTLDMVESNQLRLRRGCLVFANACASDAPAFGLNEARSFGWAFYAKGASVFIGTLGEVPIRAAFAFAERFYRELAGPASGDVGYAFQLAQKDEAMPPRLFYCLYGNPYVLPRFLQRAPRS